MEDFKTQVLTEHLADLRSCLIRSFIAAGAGFAVAYAFIKDVGDWFFKPLFEVLPDQTSLIFTSYQEAFFFT
jgi:sec-independent protein translocase protein TatC